MSREIATLQNYLALVDLTIFLNFCFCSENLVKSQFLLFFRDLSKVGGLQNKIIESFNHNNEEVKSAASYALGNISLGNLADYVPFVLKEIENQPKRQYLLLHSLKEIISAQSGSSKGITVLEPYVPAIWKQLFKHCECSEEGTRNVVAECLGKLCLICPDKLLPELRNSLSSQSPLMRTTVVTAMKFTISDQPQPIDTLLKNCIGDFLGALQDPDLNVRRVALVAFNSAAHNKPSLIRDLLRSVLPQLYNETQKRKELIREVEMGPFKHEVDDGLDLRKAAFECMYTLLEKCIDRLDIFEFLSHVQDGLKDHYDIKVRIFSQKLVKLFGLIFDFSDVDLPNGCASGTIVPWSRFNQIGQTGGTFEADCDYQSKS